MLNDFLRSIRTCFYKYLDPIGRASCSEFWYFFLFSIIISVLFNVNLGDLFNVNLGDIDLVSIVLSIPLFMVSVRRLHDVDKSGFFLLIFIIPLFGWLFLLYTWAQKGTVGNNQHGSEPE
ncbi:MAG: hypothetical protein COB24_09975 [Hyphomicrobiales bacterium]|nr:MAG: hypothetical protein COB24_09975 [Hyphomicrobiales bacterium]